uniref:Isoform B of DNA-binding protein Ewg n=2 Tax=Drosophila melanogaster TaxID=7227 RepID=Q24312-4|nr:erect wing, isoform B [Drosophila melanogaster]AAF45492.5 erect wing, isoform B [Drosophila melanogaster]|eukprot:NP_476892.4 erect wing, isoform B [Drosophila melanogaster]
MATTSYRLVVAPAGSQRSSTGNVVVTTTSSGSHSSNGANGGTGGTSAGSSTLGSGLNVTTITATSGGQLQSAGNTSQSNGTTYKIEMLEEDIQSLGSDDDDEDLISSDGSLYEGDLGSMPVNDDVAHQLAAAGPVGVAAAAAIASSKKRKRPHCFETNPSVRKRQQNRLLRKLRAIIYEFTGRVGKQAVVLVATPGKPNTSYKVFGAKPLEDVLRNLKNIVMDELDNALAQQAPPPPQDDPSLFELPGLVIDGIPTPVEKMTQAQLRAFIPLMLKYSTGRGKPGWGRESTRPPWWPKELPWANVRMDARSEDDKQKISWTHALRKIVINCYKYHGREDLLPTFADDEDKVNALISQSGDEDEDMELSNPPTIHTVTTMTPPTGNSNQPQQVNVVKINSAGTVITTHTAQSNTPAPTIIQSTNNQHVTTTATLPASTKIEICQAPAQNQQHHQHHQTHLPNAVHIQPVAGGQPQTIQLTTASGTATATAVQTTAAAVSAAQAHAHSQSQAHSQSSANQTVTAQQIANAQVCIEPITLSDVDYTTQTVLSQNADGTVSLIQVDPNNPIITLPDGTTAQVQGVATLHQGEGGATIQTVQSLTDVNGHENMTVDLTETQDGQIYITTEDGQGYPVSVSNVISVPVSMYQSVMANVQQIQTNSDGTVCLAPMQVDTSINRSTSTAASSSSSLGNGGVQCYSLISAGSSVLSRRSGGVIGHQVTPGERYYLATTTSSSLGLNNNNNCTLANNNNSVKMPIVLATPSIPQVANKRSTGKRSTGVSGGDDVMVQKRGRPNSSSRSKSQLNANENAHSSGTSSSIRCVDSASLTNVQLQLPAIKLEHLG